MSNKNTVEDLMRMIAVRKAMAERKIYILIKVPNNQIEGIEEAYLIVSDEDYAKLYPTAKVVHKAEFISTK